MRTNNNNVGVFYRRIMSLAQYGIYIPESPVPLLRSSNYSDNEDEDGVVCLAFSDGSFSDSSQLSLVSIILFTLFFVVGPGPGFY